MEREKLREFHTGLIRILCDIFGPTLAAIFRIAAEDSRFPKPKTRAILDEIFGNLPCFDTSVLSDTKDSYTREEAIFLFKKIIETAEKLSGQEGVNAIANITAEHIKRIEFDLKAALSLMGIEFEPSEDQLVFRMPKIAYKRLPLVNRIPFPVLVTMKVYFDKFDVELKEEGDKVTIVAKRKRALGVLINALLFPWTPLIIS